MTSEYLKTAEKGEKPSVSKIKKTLTIVHAYRFGNGPVNAGESGETSPDSLTQLHDCVFCWRMLNLLL